MTDGTTGQPTTPEWYEIRLQGRLDRQWSAWFDGLQVTSEADGTTLVRGPVADQSALHGLLSRMRDLGVVLISVTRTEPDPHHPASLHPNGD